MTITVEDLIRQITALEMSAQAMLLNARVLRRQVEVALVGVTLQQSEPDGRSAESTPTPPTTAAEPIDCKCPVNLRKAAATPQHPRRTVCRRCEKEFLS